jgi:hypothetical protein
VAKPTRLTHKIMIQLHLPAESCTICSSCSRWQVWKLLDTPLYDSNLDFKCFNMNSMYILLYNILGTLFLNSILLIFCQWNSLMGCTGSPTSCRLAFTGLQQKSSDTFKFWFIPIKYKTYFKLKEFVLFQRDILYLI